MLVFRRFQKICERWSPTPMHLKGAADLNAARIPPARFEEVEGIEGLVGIEGAAGVKCSGVEEPKVQSSTPLGLTSRS